MAGFASLFAASFACAKTGTGHNKSEVTRQMMGENFAIRIERLVCTVLSQKTVNRWIKTGDREYQRILRETSRWNSVLNRVSGFSLLCSASFISSEESVKKTVLVLFLVTARITNSCELQKR